MANFTPSSSTIASVGIGIPVATIISWVLNQCCQMEMPGEVQAATGALTSAIVGYFFAGGKAVHLEAATIDQSEAPHED